MKKFILSILVIIGCMAVMASCTKKSAAPSVGMSAEVNGNDWNPTAALAQAETVMGQYRLAISGTILNDDKSVQSLLTINIPWATGAVGTYHLSSPVGINGSNAGYTDGITPHIASTGTLIITVATATNIQGTFSFVADNFTITNGKFNLNGNF